MTHFVVCNPGMSTNGFFAESKVIVKVSCDLSPKSEPNLQFVPSNVILWLLPCHANLTFQYTLVRDMDGSFCMCALVKREGKRINKFNIWAIRIWPDSKGQKVVQSEILSEWHI